MWPRIWVVFLTGVAAAFLVGKVPAALPALRGELSLSLFQAGLVVSLFSLIAAACGILLGSLSDRLGQRRLAVAGLVAAAGAGIAGGWAASPEALLATRVAEGIGFFLMSVSLPGLIIRLADDRARAPAMGLWGAYLPLGAGLVLLAGGAVISLAGWRGLWIGISLLYPLFIAALVWAVPRDDVPAPDVHPVSGSRMSRVLRTPGAVMLAAVFGCYSGQYLAVTSFVPLILVEQAGWQLAPAAAAGAGVMVANTTGNVAAGLLLRRGWRRRTLLLAASAVMAAGAVLVMYDTVPVVWRIAGAVAFSAFGGMIPGSLFAGVAQHAPSPAHVATVNGLMLQGVAVGQLVGPAAVSWLVGAGGGNWAWALAYLLPMAALTAIAAVCLGIVERRQARNLNRASTSGRISSK